MSQDVIHDLERSGELHEALEQLDKIERSPGSSLQKADILRFLGRNKEALNLLNPLVSSNKNIDDLDIQIGILVVHSEIMLTQGQTKETENNIKLIEKIRTTSDGSSENKQWLGRILRLNGLLLEKQFKLDEAFKFYKDSLKHFERIRNTREMAISIHSLGFIEESKGNLDSALKSYQKALEIRNAIGNEFDIANSLNRIGVIYGKKSDFGKAEKYFKDGLGFGQKVDHKLELARIFVNLGIIKKMQGDLDSAKNDYNEALVLSKALNDQHNISKAYINVGNIQLDNGDLDEAIETYYKAIPILEKLGAKQDKGSLYNNLGNVYKTKGEFSEALKFYKKSLGIKKELGQENLIAPTILNIGIIHVLKGELNSALENLEKSLVLWDKLGNTIDKALALQYIGLIHLERSNHEESIYCLVDCLNLRKKAKNDILISETLYHLILAEMDRDNNKKAEKYYSELIKINKKANNKLIKTRTRLAQAIFLQKDTRINKKVEAQELFEEVLAEGIIDNELTIFAMLKLCEFLLLELKVSGEKEVLVEIKTLLEKLYEMAQEQESHTLLIEILIIQSQLALVDYNVKETKEFLDHANEIAEDKELTQYKLKISYLQDSVEKDVIKFANIASSVPINDRINQLQIESYLKEVADHKDLNSFDPEMFKTGLKKNLQMHLNFANLLLMDKTLPEEMKKYVHFIDLSSKEIQFSISTLLMIEKLEAGTYYQNLEDFNCDEIIQFRINHYEEKLNEKSLVVDFQKTNGITTVRSDQYLFSRIMDHLLDNAIKFADEKSTIKIILETDENSRTITIENECETIPEHEQSNLFDKYTQYLIHESTRKHGVGLGLSFCDLAVKSIKGKVSLTSPRPNKDSGVTVSIRIPKEI